MMDHRVPLGSGWAHKAIERNEIAEQWAKKGAGASSADWLPREEDSITTLAHEFPSFPDCVLTE
jgi:hypothetical protein